MNSEHYFQRGFLTSLAFFFFISFAQASFVVVNDGVLPEKTVKKIDEIGAELYQKTGVWVYLAVTDKKDIKNIKEYEKKISKELQSPFVLLSTLLFSQKIDIINSSSLNDKFDKEQILSPYPWSGSILPLLTSNSKDFKASVEAAMLNGYAEIADQIANSYNINLESSLGNQNKDTYLVIKLLFYGTIVLIAFNFIRHRYFYKN